MEALAYLLGLIIISILTIAYAYVSIKHDEEEIYFELKLKESQPYADILCIERRHVTIDNVMMAAMLYYNIETIDEIPPHLYLSVVRQVLRITPKHRWE